jgi:hypothetical protein
MGGKPLLVKFFTSLQSGLACMEKLLKAEKGK